MRNKADKAKLSFIESVMESNAEMPLNFYYSNELMSLEQTLMIEDRDYPKLVCVWQGINSYRIYNDPMEETFLEGFIKKIMDRRSWIKFGAPVKKVMFPPTNEEL